MADFSDLPDVVWVNILSELTLPERCNIAQTCHRLHSLFSHPSLWNKANIVSNAGENKMKMQKVLIEKYGNYIQDLNLSFFSFYLKGISPETKSLFQALAEKCNLEALTLDGEYRPPKKMRSLFTTDIEGVLAILDSAYRVKYLNIKSWPIDRDYIIPELPTVLKRNDKLAVTVDNLSLFYVGAGKDTWTTNVNLPNIDDTINIIQFYSNLRVLKLRSCMISNKVILELATSSRRGLEKLCILVKYAYNAVRNDNKLPQICSHAWQQLAAHSPKLNVDFTFVTRIPHMHLQEFLKPEIPVAAVNFMQFAECRSIDIEGIVEKYSKTLTKFTNYSSANEELNDAVINMVTTCKELNYFLHTGMIHHRTVRAIAKEKGKKWYFFQINSDSVITQDIEKIEDQDAVLRKRPDGTYEIASHSNLKVANDTESQNIILAEMIKEVASYLGQRWIPMNLLEREDIDQVRQQLYDTL